MRFRSFSFLLVVAMSGVSLSGCVSVGRAGEVSQNNDLRAASSSSAYVLHVTTAEGQIVITADTQPNSDICVVNNFCQFAYIAGSSLTLTIPNPFDTVNCDRFIRWEGDCQGRTCDLVINRDLNVHAIWGPIRGCTPR